MGLYDTYKTSGKLEKEGVWRDFGYCRVLVARAGGSNQKYNAIIEKVNKQQGRALAAGLIGNAKALAMLEDAFAESIILAWETNVGGDEANPVWKAGIENSEGGELLPFTVENVKATIHNLPDLFAEIRQVAQDQQFYRQSLIDEAAKN
jgi:hypothetical protein